LEAVHIEIQNVIMETIKHILNVSKSIALYLNYMHIKASIPMEKHPDPGGK